MVGGIQKNDSRLRKHARMWRRLQFLNLEGGVQGMRGARRAGMKKGAMRRPGGSIKSKTIACSAC
jgi:hypothetical protein